MSIQPSATASRPSYTPRILTTAVIERAGLWWARAQADDATPEDQAGCNAWRQQHPDHEQAWQAMVALDQQLTLLPSALPANMAQQVLSSAAAQRKHSKTRRQLLGLGLAIPGTAALLVAARGTPRWQTAWADHATGTGEIRSITLADGTQLTLDSASAIDVDYSSQQRRIVLHAGQVMVTSAKDPQTPARPLLVHTPHGNSTAIGTRFSVATTDTATYLEVFEGAVLAEPAALPSAAMRIDAGQASSYNQHTVFTPQPIQPGADGWTKGLLSVSDMRLAELLEQLAHYRTGIVRCDPAVADLRVTGVFALHASDRALHNLSLALPIRLQYRTRYWVMVLPL